MDKVLFENENYDREHQGVELGDEIFEKIRFVNCKFVNCTFEKTKFIACKFDSCEFDHCILINVDIAQSVFDEVTFTQTKLMALNWSEIRNFHTKLRFIKSKIQYSSFLNLELIELYSDGSEFLEIDFINCSLEKSVWNETLLERTNFSKCSLKLADFSTAKKYLISAKENFCKKTKFSYPEVIDSLELVGIEVEDI